MTNFPEFIITDPLKRILLSDIVVFYVSSDTSETKIDGVQIAVTECPPNCGPGGF